jgi:peptidyl-prolyl cis-trans isomerase C
MKDSRVSRFAVLLALALIVAVTGCAAGDGKGTEDKNAKAPSAQPAQEPAPAGQAAQTPPASAPPAAGAPAAASPGAPGAAPSGPPIVPSGPADQVVAKVNSKQIKRGDLDFAIKNIAASDPRIQSPDKWPELRKSVLDELIDQELLYQKATASNVSVPDKDLGDQMTQLKSQFPNEKAFVDQLAKDGMTPDKVQDMLRRRLVITKYVRSTIVDQIKVTPEDEQKFYADNKERLKHPEQIRASHIMRTVKQDAKPEERAAQKAKIDEALARAKKGEDFAALAKEYSQDGSAPGGGDLGFFGKGDYPEPFDKAAWALKDGQVSDVVTTQFGFHIIKVTAHRAEGYVPFEEVKEQLDHAVTQQKIQAELEKLRTQLRSTAKIDVTL